MFNKDYKRKIKQEEKDFEDILYNIAYAALVFLTVVLAIGGAVCMFSLLYMLLKSIIS